MPLSNEQYFGVAPLTEAINKLPTTPSILRELGIFKPKFLYDKKVCVENREGVLSLVEAVPRGTPGKPSKTKVQTSQTFEMTHLPKKDTVLADDTQGIRSFNGGGKAQAVIELVNDKFEDMKADIEYTREGHQLGALKGKILNADGSVLLDINNRFGITQKNHNIELSKDTTIVGKTMDTVKVDLRSNLKGESSNGWLSICGAEFYQELIYHKSVYDLYKVHKDAKVLIDGQNYETFTYQGVTYVLYDHEFENEEKMEANEALFLPKGTRKAFFEYFAPANMNATVNTKAKAYYASREKLDHDKGWDLEAQSNPLALVTRPDLVFKLTMT